MSVVVVTAVDLEPKWLQGVATSDSSTGRGFYALGLISSTGRGVFSLGLDFLDRQRVSCLGLVFLDRQKGFQISP